MICNIELIKANENDCKYIYELVCLLEQSTFDYNVFSNNYLNNLVNKDINYFIIKYEQQQCGFISVYTQILLHHNSKIGEIQEFIVEEKYRGKGIGKDTIEIIKEICKKNYVVQIEVCTNKIRQDTQKFYKANKFIESHYKYVIKI